MNLLLYKLRNKHKQGDDFTSVRNIDEIDTRILHTHLVSIFWGKKSWKIGKDAERTLKIISGWRKCLTVGHWKYSICLDYSRFKGGLIMYAHAFITKNTEHWKDL